MIHRNSYSSSKLIEKKKKRKKIKIILFFVVFVLTIVLGIYLFNLDRFKIKEIKIQEAKYSNQDLIKKNVEDILNTKYFYFLNKSNSLFYPKQELKLKIKEQDISIQEITTKISDWDNLVIIVKEYDPVAFYCKDELKNDCYLMNKNGFIFEKGIDFSKELLRVSGLLDNQSELVGQNYSNSEIFPKIIEISNLLKDKKYELDYVSSKDNETFEIHLKNGPYLIIQKDFIAEKIIENLEITIKKDSIHDIQFQNIQYMDLRFDNKVYYKIK